jgi:hypothetical protein
VLYSTVVVCYQMHDEFRVVTDDLSVDKLLEKFVNKKTTGQERPGNSIN